MNDIHADKQRQDANPDAHTRVSEQSSIRADFHTHTCFSHDGHQTPRELVERARDVQLDRVAVTDHHTLDGALRARDLDPERIVVGEEITTRCRTDIIGLFLTTRIAPRLSLEQVVDEIRAQGGVVYLPHPFAYITGARRRVDRALSLVDIVEVWNSRAFYSPWNRRAVQEVRERGIPEAGGSDAHFSAELGRAWTVLPTFSDAATLKRAARRARAQNDGHTYALPFVGSITCMALSLIKRPIRTGGS
ncbi:MAG TPA: PHP-associated domain-containing protein [Gemmatimonadaceae bacterium]|nr:PHP-associated domain-containing protein [Gemmatimonadaceae bacterium]